MAFDFGVAALLLFGSWDVDLRPGLTDVKHQGNRNTCSAFAATALAEFVLRERTGEAVDLSEAHAYWAGHTRGAALTGTSRFYRGVDGLAGFIAVAGVAQGVALESAWPYDPLEAGLGDRPSDLTELPDSFEVVRVPRFEVAEFLLRERRPVVMNISWYRELFDSAGNATRLPSAEEARACLTTSGVCYGHVVLLVGYSRSARRFLFRNSWEPSGVPEVTELFLRSGSLSTANFASTLRQGFRWNCFPVWMALRFVEVQ